ncbi:WD40 repeat-like protein [Annulohypoxylon truncatum]|uniref:WD40 repeat-like protein n=1 Tax=Annulohypoxylon truncatum TaxID=327061 RepID=UPI002008967E|nr:WD40 repeat-like protein [Annulohypoxylon truncatum]KAI1204382.1 WD40 repeat-like protein [Annulohypoxylon truncatum]
MSTSSPATEVARPRPDDLPAVHANAKINQNGSEPLRDLGRSPTSSDDPSTSILGTGKKSVVKLSRKDTAGKDAKEKKDLDTAVRPGPQATSSSALDPLSHHIFVRTNTDRSIASRFRNPARSDSPATNEGLPRPSSDLSTKQVAPQPDLPRDRRKGGFLSRLSMIGGKKKEGGIHDDESEISELRTEGANAVAFSSAVGAGGYIPHHKEPPRYIRVRAHNKKIKEFNRMFLAQELVGTQPPNQDDDQAKTTNGASATQGLGKDESELGGPIWAIEFSKDGKYLATGGRDRVVRIWAVIATEEDRKAEGEEENAASDTEERLSAPVFRAKPVREFVGHTGDILDLSWSKNNFLLSSSMDKTVRLWHISRQECLCTFKHKDFVTSIAFHPRDDRFFLAGSLDSYLRLWSIPDKAVAYSSQLSDFITAVAFSPDGRTAIAGCLNGFCMFYETEGLKYHTQIHVRSSRGKNAKGSKITGIETMRFPPDAPDGVVKVLVTSNDSRIRIYNMGDKNLELKLKGHENTCSQIRATFNDDGNYIICGSEDKRAFIWSTSSRLAENKEKRPYEYFEAHSSIVTSAIFAPTSVRQLLQTSGDPIFTLCNPPPITLRSKEESTVNQAVDAQDTQSESSNKVKKPDESPGFIARSAHYDGNIVVTTDHTGLIKVFRQDCAFTKRRHDNWETGSTFSRKLGRDSLLGRSGSIATRFSAGSRDPHSRRGSLTQPPQSIQGIFQANSERINTWRHGVEGHTGRPTSITISTPARSERSLSPSKAARTPINSTSGPRRQPYANTSAINVPTSPTSSVQANRTNDRVGLREVSVPPTPSFSFRPVDEEEDELRLDPAGASYSFWNLNKWRNISPLRGNGSSLGSDSAHQRSQSTALVSDTTAVEDNRRKSLATGTGEAEANGKSDKHTRRKSVPAGAILSREKDENHLAPPVPVSPRPESYASRLSSELTSEDGEDMQCPSCGSRDFRAKKVGGKQRLQCGKCGRAVNS